MDRLDRRPAVEAQGRLELPEFVVGKGVVKVDAPLREWRVDAHQGELLLQQHEVVALWVEPRNVISGEAHRQRPRDLLERRAACDVLAGEAMGGRAVGPDWHAGVDRLEEQEHLAGGGQQCAQERGDAVAAPQSIRGGDIDDGKWFRQVTAGGHLAGCRLERLIPRCAVDVPKRHLGVPSGQAR